MITEKTISKNVIKTQLQPIKDLTFNKKYTIGIPCEINPEEKRIAFTPESVRILTKMGYKILIEKNAGVGANFSDFDYSENGATISQSHKDIFSQSDIIIKISPLSEKEIDFLGQDKIIFSAINLFTQNEKNLKKLKEKKTTALAFEFFLDNQGFNPFLHIIGEIIGSSSVMIAAEIMSNTNGGNGNMLGGISGIEPSEIIILGSEICSQYAVKIAMGLGANVKVFDNSIKKLIKLHDFFGQHLYTSTLSNQSLHRALINADVLINTLEKGINDDFIITNEMLNLMKQGAVIIDLKVDTGSVIESSKITSFKNPTFVKEGVIHYCVPNIASRVSRTSSVAISNLLTPYLADITKCGGIIPFILNNVSCRNAVYMLKGITTNKTVAEKFNLDYTDINIVIYIF